MTIPAADPAHRHGGPDAGWYRPGPDGWQRITDAQAANDRPADMAHFMSDPNGHHGPDSGWYRVTAEGWQEMPGPPPDPFTPRIRMRRFLLWCLPARKVRPHP